MIIGNDVCESDPLFNFKKITTENSKIYNVKINTKDRVVLFIYNDSEYAVRFKNTDDVEKRIEEAKIKIENGKLFFAKNLADHYFKLFTEEQLLEEERKRKYSMGKNIPLDHNCQEVEQAEEI